MERGLVVKKYMKEIVVEYRDGKKEKDTSARDKALDDVPAGQNCIKWLIVLER